MEEWEAAHCEMASLLEGTAQLLTNERPDLLDEYGGFVDTLLEEKFVRSEP